MNTTWVYIKTEPGLWTVGFYAPDGEFHSDSDHNSKEEAGERVHYLNGAICTPQTDFTKIEKASIMIASGYVANNGFDSPDATIAKYCVETAKIILEEANK